MGFYGHSSLADVTALQNFLRVGAQESYERFAHFPPIDNQIVGEMAAPDQSLNIVQRHFRRDQQQAAIEPPPMPANARSG